MEIKQDEVEKVETITLADGTVLENSHVLNDSENLFFYIQNGMSMAKVFSAMNNTKKTATIRAFQYQQETIYEGFTDLCAISKENNQISGRLRRSAT